MVVRQSEFARMCGVSPAAIGIAAKQGRVVKNKAGRIDTFSPKNKAYLRRRQVILCRRKKSAVDNWNALTELGEPVYSQHAQSVVAACRSIIQYVESQERALAERERVVHKPVDAAAVNFLRELTDKICGTSYDNEFSHDALLLAMDPDYRLCYMNALAQSRKRKAGGVTPAIPIPGKARAGRKGLNQSV